MILYIEVTTDIYEYPVAVAESVVELAKICNVSANTISFAISHEKRGDYVSKFKKVEIDDD